MSYSSLFSLFLTLSVSSAFKISISNIGNSNYTERLAIPGDVTYYIAALEVPWNYAPNGTNILDNGLPVDQSSTSAKYTKSGTDRIGKVYLKALYRQFTDQTFTTQVNRTGTMKHLGVLGPIIRAVTGQRIKIVFYNKCSYNYSMHPHGVQYDKTSEGALYVDGTPNYGDSIMPGQKWVYFWDARDESGGSYDEVSSKFWFYHSHVNEPKDTNAGLVGPMIITKNGQNRSKTDFQPNDVDKEFFTLFSVFDENLSWYAKNNTLTYCTNLTTTYENLTNDGDFHESNLMHSMNGYSWGSVLGGYLTNMSMGQRVRWYVGAMGTEVDIHSAHWHGNVVNFRHRFEDVVQLMPAITQTMDMIPDKAGTFFYHCHVNDHVEAGMIATYTVLNQTISNPRTTPANPITLAINNLVSSGTLSNNNDDWDWVYVLKITAFTTAVNFLIVLLVASVYSCCRKKDNKKSDLNEVLLVESSKHGYNM